jgi:hypothetical protein
MLRKITAVSILALAAPTVAPSVAMAEVTFDGAFTAGYTFGNIDNANIDLHAGEFMFEGDIGFGGGFEVGFDANFTLGQATAGGTDVDIDISRLQLAPRYNFGAFYVGGYFQNTSVDVGIAPPFALSLDMDSYGGFVGYATANYWTEFYYGQSEINTGNTDVDDIGIAGGYRFGSSMEVFGHYAMSTVDTGGGDIEVMAAALGAQYGFKNGLSVFGSLGYAEVDDTGGGFDGDATEVSLGVAYGMARNSAFPVTVSAEVARREFDGNAFGNDEMTTVRLGVTVPFGNASTLPLNSSARIARGDYRSAISELVGSAF